MTLGNLERPQRAKRMRAWMPFLCALAGGLAAQAASYQEHFYNLEYDEAIEVARAAAHKTPEEPRWWNELAQMLLYRELYRAGVLDSELVTGDNPLVRRPKLSPPEEVLAEVREALARAFSLSEKRLRREGEKAETLYELGVSHGCRANVHFFVHKAWHPGLQDAIRARKLHERALDLDPALADARLIVGAHDYLIANLPAVYRVMASMVSLGGSRERGIQTIEVVAREGSRNRVTAEMLLAVIYRREKQPEKALPLVASLARRYPRNHLFPLEEAQVLGDARRFDEALARLEDVESLRLAGAPGFAGVAAEKIRFVRGMLFMQSGRAGEAITEFEWVVSAESGAEKEMRGQAWVRLGQIRDGMGERAAAMAAYQAALRESGDGEAAEQAKRYIKSPFRAGAGTGG